MTRARDVANLIGSGNYSSTTFTATAGQTAFTISHTQGFVQVFMNGLLLDETVDYTSNGSAVTLTSGAAAGDEIEVVAYNTFSVGDALNQAAADTRYVNTTGDTMTGNLGVNVSPTAALDVRRSDTDGKIAEFHQSAGYGFDISSSQTVATMGSGYLQTWKFTTDAGSGAVEQMRISKEGYITMPSQPAFAVATTSGGSQTLTANVYTTITNFTTVRANAGNHFTSSGGNAGRFTAPVTGNYWFGFQILLRDVGSSDNSIHVAFYKNGTAYQYGNIRAPGGAANAANATSYGGYLPVMGHSLIPMSVNDYIDLRGYSSGVVGVHGSNAWGNYYGCLVG